MSRFIRLVTSARVTTSSELRQKLGQLVYLSRTDDAPSTPSVWHNFLRWTGMHPMVKEHIASCNSCQWNKHSKKKSHSKIPLTPALRSKNPWDKVQVDCCGPWTIRYHNKVTGRISLFQIHLLSMVDICNRWPEFAQINSANSIVTAKAFDKNWLCH